MRNFNWEKLGQAKVMFERQFRYLSLLNFIMLASIFIGEHGWHWYYLCAVPLAIGSMIIDNKYILPGEINYIHGKSSVLKNLGNGDST